MTTPLPSEYEDATQKSWVTYILCSPSSSASSEGVKSAIRLHESRAVISGAGTTGLRTWEAALHLGSYLVDSPKVAANLIREKHVLELGAGTGFLSILCAKALGAKHVTATDGADSVVEAIKENLFANDIETGVATGVYRWGWTLKDSFLEQQTDEHGPIETVIGADVVSSVHSHGL